MKTKPWLISVLAFVLVLGLSAQRAAQAQRDDPASITPPDTVTIAGTVQPEVGCSGAWDTTCAESKLTYDAANDLWWATFDLPAGSYEYKAALNGSWDDNYGLNAEYYGANIPLEVSEDGPVIFWYDHKTRWVSDSINSLLANVPGSFQDEIGCPGDWQPACLRSMLQDPDGDGVYQFITASIPPGDYEAKVAVGQSWAINYGEDGAPDGPNIPFSAPEGEAVIFTFNPATNLLTISTGDPALAAASAAPAGGGLPNPAVPPPDLVVVPGTIQSVLGCAGDWDPACQATALPWDGEDQLWTATFDIPAGDYEYKVALNGSWDVNFGLDAQPGGPNIPLSLAEDTEVSFFFSNQTGWIADSVNNLIANVPGDFQDEIGCPGDWQPTCLASWLQDPDGDGIFVFQTVSIPAGSYEAKVAVNQSWAENYGEGGALDGANIGFSVPEDESLVTFTFDSRSKLLQIAVGSGGIQGNINEQRAYWVTAATIAWPIEHAEGNQYFFHYTPAGGSFALGFDGVEGGTAVPLTFNPNGLGDDVLAKFPHLRRAIALEFPSDFSSARTALKGQIAVSAQDADGAPLNATGLQIPGVLDDLYRYDGPLGVTWEGGVPTVRLWAPTARLVRFHLFPDAATDARDALATMRVDPTSGVWTITGAPDWAGKYYLFEVQVYVPSQGSVQTNIVTDPYSVSLALNSTRSQLVDLANPELTPSGWAELGKPALNVPEDIVVYELHMRDFSVNDPSVPAEYQGTFKAFTVAESNGMRHLAALAEAGLTHLHLLPTFDLATIDENKAAWSGPTFAELAQFPPDSEEQQALIDASRDQDPFNWGYDPFHYNVPEGSYSTDPNGPARIVEFREMVQSLNQTGLRVVVDVVYNHTNASGQSPRSVLDRVVPGYYHRLNAAGKVERSTCCDNTATEHDMMRKLMVDSVVLWAVQYKVDGFRFDLMGHHMQEDMLAVRAALDALTLEEHGVDGRSIYVYGEGWNFGEVADNARGVNATQFNMAGTGIGTFNDRLRDAARGGSPFGGQTEQGFVTGLFTDPNDFDQGSAEAQLEQLLHFADLIRVGLAGNLKDYPLINAKGEQVTGRQILYNGQFAGYTLDPQENIVYVSKHDNETLFDVIQYKAPLATSAADRARMQTLGNALVMFSQGIPFFQAGDDLLRSKSLDRNSYNSGDWFNRLDFTYQENNWGVGLPPAADNSGMWPVMQPLLANPDLAVTPAEIAFARDAFRELLQIRRSSPLFRLQTAAEVNERLAFHNVGPDQIPGLIVMSISDLVGENLDPNFALVVVLFNAGNAAQTIAPEATAGLTLTLHPVLASSVDPAARTAAFDAASGTFSVPARTTAVFVLDEAAAPTRAATVELDAPAAEEPPAPEAEPTTAAAETAEPAADTGGAPWGALAGGAIVVAGAAGVAAWLARRKRTG